MKTLFIRLIQKILFLVRFLLNIKEAVILSGDDAYIKCVDVLINKEISSILLCVSGSVYRSGKVNPLIDELTSKNIRYEIYNTIPPNPTKESVDIGVDKYKNISAQGIIAIGGGSVIDCAKVIGAIISNKKPISKLKGVLKLHKKLPLLIVAPTTAGSGTECTIAAVVINGKDKFAITDPKLLPKYAILDPTLLYSLPSRVSSESGMDVLTHAIEAYIGKSNTKFTSNCSLKAIKTVFENLENSVNYPDNYSYRKNMLLASYNAGLAITRAYVGYVHAIAHSLGGLYNLSHGLLNAILLPVVLKSYGKSAYKKLGQIYDYLYPNNNLTNKEKSEALIDKINALNTRLNIINNFKDKIDLNDLDYICKHVKQEVIPLYPTPRFLSDEEVKEIVINLTK